MKILECFEQIKQQLVDAGWDYNGMCYLKDDSHDFSMKVGIINHGAGEMVKYDWVEDVYAVLNIDIKKKKIYVLYGVWVDDSHAGGDTWYHRYPIGGSDLLCLCNNSEQIINDAITKAVAHVTRSAKNAPMKYPRKEVVPII